MEALLARMEKWMRQYRPEFFKSLLPGRTEKQLQAMEKTLGVALPDDFKALYAWRGGQSSKDYYSDFDLNHASFISARQSITTWRVYKKNNHDFLQDGFSEIKDGTLVRAGTSLEAWNDKWIPFLDWKTADLMCLDLSGSFGGKPGQLIRYVHDADYRTIAYSSLRAWLLTSVSVLESEPKSWVEWEDSDVMMSIYTPEYDPGYPKIV